MKKIKFLLIVCLVLLAMLYFARNIIIKNIFAQGVKAITGLEMEITDLNIGVFKPVIEVSGLNLFNPQGFKDKLMLDLPQVYLDYDLGAFFRNMVHLKKLKLNLKELTIVRNEKGALNLKSLAALQPKGKGKMPQLKIESMDLAVGKVIYKDYFNLSQPKTLEFNLNINEHYANINGPAELAGLIALRVISHTGIAGLADFDLGFIKSKVSGNFKEAARSVVDAADNAIKTGKDTGKAVKATVDSLKKIFK